MLTRLRHMITAPVRRIHRALHRRAHAMLFEHHTHRGVLLRIHISAPDGSLDMLTKAIDCIASTDPLSHRRLPQLLPGGIAAEATTYAAAWYNRSTETCFIGAETLKIGDTLEIALCIIHEMCHARLFEHGIGYEEALRVRVEQVCIRRELAFARKIDTSTNDTTELIDWLKHRQSAEAEHSVSNADLGRFHRRQFLERLRMLKQNDVPKCIRRFIIMRARRRRASNRVQRSDAY